jgi:ABC-type transporter Mla subunit MlaD
MAFLGCHKSESFRFQVAFPDTQGVKKDTSVFYRGIQVGKVERIYLQSASSDQDTEVVLDIVLANASAKVREKDIIRATAFGLLGDRVIDIVPGASSSPLVASGSKLRGEIQPSLQEVSVFLKELTEVAPKFSFLPQQKKDELLKTFRAMVDREAEELRIGTQPANSKER